jgi:hypothetical protein
MPHQNLTHIANIRGGGGGGGGGGVGEWMLEMNSAHYSVIRVHIGTVMVCNKVSMHDKPKIIS